MNKNVWIWILWFEYSVSMFFFFNKMEAILRYVSPIGFMKHANKDKTCRQNVTDPMSRCIELNYDNKKGIVYISLFIHLINNLLE